MVPDPVLIVQVMTWRARAYLTIACLRHLILGTMMLVAPQTFIGRAWDGLFAIAPRVFWAGALLVGGTHLAYAAWRESPGHARTALVISAAVSLMWAGAFGLVVLSGSASVFATVVFTAMAAKDLVICAQPLRTPFEHPRYRHHART